MELVLKAALGDLGDSRCSESPGGRWFVEKGLEKGVLSTHPSPGCSHIAVTEAKISELQERLLLRGQGCILLQKLSDLLAIQWWLEESVHFN